MMSVIIIGGGMAGATLALALAHFSQGRLAVHLVEAQTLENHHHPGFDARALALSHGTCQQLAQMGIWQVTQDVACAIRQVQVSHQGHCGFVTLNASDYQIDALGHVVELHHVGQRLFSLLRQSPGVTLHCPARVAQFFRSDQQVSVQLDNGTLLQGQLMVATDGTLSPLASQCGICWQQTPYQQLAVIANITTAQPHQGRAFECFTPQGPLALLPAINRCSLVWCLSCERQQQVMNWSDNQFCDALQQAFGWRLGRITHAGKRTVYPLALSVAQRIVSHRLALAGNAAQTLHPVAGQGFNLGIRDVISLAKILSDAASRQQDIGSYPVLAAYQRQRMADRNATIALTDGLINLFANHWQPLTLCRNLALMTMDLASPLRDKLAYRALGWVAR